MAGVPGSSSSPMQLDEISTNDVEFMAEDTPITIVPKTSIPALHLMCGEVGPLLAGMPTAVPLWVALALKQKNCCTITPPAWMSVESLRGMVARERRTLGSVLELVPPTYREVTTLLLQNAPEDVANRELVKSLVEDLENVRSQKLRSGFTEIVEDQLNQQQAVEVITIDHIGNMEAHTLRPLILKGLGQFTAIRQAQEYADIAAQHHTSTHRGAAGGEQGGVAATGRRKLRNR